MKAIEFSFAIVTVEILLVSIGTECIALTVSINFALKQLKRKSQYNSYNTTLSELSYELIKQVKYRCGII